MMVIIQPADQLPHVELVDGDDPPHSWDQSDQWSVWSVWLKFQYDHWSLISDVAWSVWQHFSKDSMIDSNSLSFQVKKVDMRRDHVHQYHHRVSENKSYSYESLSSQNSFSLEKISDDRIVRRQLAWAAAKCWSGWWSRSQWRELDPGNPWTTDHRSGQIRNINSIITITIYNNNNYNSDLYCQSESHMMAAETRTTTLPRASASTWRNTPWSLCWSKHWLWW